MYYVYTLVRYVPYDRPPTRSDTFDYLCICICARNMIGQRQQMSRSRSPRLIGILAHTHTVILSPLAWEEVFCGMASTRSFQVHSCARADCWLAAGRLEPPFR